MSKISPLFIFFLLANILISPLSAQEYKLVWSDEFNTNGLPNPAYWNFEEGFVRNNELQWYQDNNAYCKDGVLVIQAKKERKPNPNFDKNRESLVADLQNEMLVEVVMPFNL